MSKIRVLCNWIILFTVPLWSPFFCTYVFWIVAIDGKLPDSKFKRGDDWFFD